jgi:hypothetical protein
MSGGELLKAKTKVNAAPTAPPIRNVFRPKKTTFDCCNGVGIRVFASTETRFGGVRGASTQVN